jgi:hypothetical protein
VERPLLRVRHHLRAGLGNSGRLAKVPISTLDPAQVWLCVSTGLPARHDLLPDTSGELLVPGPRPAAPSASGQSIPVRRIALGANCAKQKLA